MIEIVFFKTKKNVIWGFEAIGHANYDHSGKDIVCAGVSALIINTVNSIEKFTSIDYQLDTEEKSGTVILKIPSLQKGESNHVCELLLNSLELGITAMTKEYKDFLHFTVRRCPEC